MTREDFPAPEQGILVTHFLTAGDVARSRDFYAEVIGGTVVRESSPAMVKLANSWIIINEGGGPTADKPEVILAPPDRTDRVSSFLNIRVADIAQIYREWSSRGAVFLTDPVDFGGEIRAYVRDPDGYLIEVGQSTGVLAEIEG